MWLAERVWEPHLARTIGEAGVVDQVEHGVAVPDPAGLAVRLAQLDLRRIGQAVRLVAELDDLDARPAKDREIALFQIGDAREIIFIVAVARVRRPVSPSSPAC